VLPNDYYRIKNLLRNNDMQNATAFLHIVDSFFNGQKPAMKYNYQNYAELLGNYIGKALVAIIQTLIFAPKFNVASQKTA
jgi:hypothetical protein